MVIKTLKPSQHVQGRWLAVLEDGAILRLGEGEVVDFALYEGKELSEEERTKLMDSVRRSELKEKALNLLSRKPQSRRELTRKLLEWDAGEEEAEAICDRLEELGYLSDASYAGQIVRHYSGKGFGEKKLRDELYRRGIPRELWEDAMAQAQDPTDSIDAFVRKKLGGQIPDRKELQRVSAALARRGFGWSEIKDALGRYEQAMEDWEE